MYDAGYHQIWNMDISSVVIEQMSERNKDRIDMKWDVMDVWEMSYENNFFDIAIDKSTIDALLCGDNAFINVAKMTQEVQRVLKQGGYYFVISYGNPESRVDHFKQKHLDFKVEEKLIYYDPLDETRIHYVYIC